MPQNLTFYHPNNAGKGSAASFEYRWEADKDSVLLFLVMANQKGKNANGNGTFDWDNKITVKMGENDVGEFLCVLNAVKDTAGSGKGLYHKSGSGNKIINFEFKDGSYYLNVSQKDSNKGDQRGYISIYPQEAELLKIMLSKYVELLFDWHIGLESMYSKTGDGGEVDNGEVAEEETPVDDLVLDKEKDLPF